MDIGKFKASRGRLILWILIPPFLIAGIGLTSYALNQQVEWELERTRVLSEILPKTVKARQSAEALIEQFNNSESGRIKTEDELISFLQNAAGHTGFTVDSLKVERRVSASNQSVPILTAHVRGSGSMTDIQTFLGDVTSRQQLLSENSLQISQSGRVAGEESCRADITFELILFNHKLSGGGA